MKKYILAILSTFIVNTSIGQSETSTTIVPESGNNVNQSEISDTTYVDEEFNAVDNIYAATYYVIDYNKQTNVKYKPVKFYYTTGELYKEAVLKNYGTTEEPEYRIEGEVRDYYKSGKLMTKQQYTSDELNGDYTEYYENGLIKSSGCYVNGKVEGTVTVFLEDGKRFIRTEFVKGNLKNNYMTWFDGEGHSIKIRSNGDDFIPIMESPQTTEITKQYVRGNTWLIYNKNALSVCMNNTMTRGYGKWFQINISIANYSPFPVVFDPETITAILAKDENRTKPLEVYSYQRYMKKVQRRQNLALSLLSIAEGFAAAGAGYSTTTSRTNYSYGGTSYGSSGISAYGGRGSITTRTTTYDQLAAYQAQVIAANNVNNYSMALAEERIELGKNYLLKTTINPGETISGYINIKRKSGKMMRCTLNIGGAQYNFDWSIQ